MELFRIFWRTIIFIWPKFWEHSDTFLFAVSNLDSLQLRASKVSINAEKLTRRILLQYVRLLFSVCENFSLKRPARTYPTYSQSVRKYEHVPLKLLNLKNLQSGFPTFNIISNCKLDKKHIDNLRMFILEDKYQFRSYILLNK